MGSHHRDITPLENSLEGWRAGLIEDVKYRIAEDDFRAWPHLTPMVGLPGTTFAMHPKLWHFSEANLSSQPRVLLSVIFNDTKNPCVPRAGKEQRPEFVA